MLRKFEKKRNVSFHILWTCYAFLVYVVKERDEMVMMQRNEARVFRAQISFTGCVAGRCWGKNFLPQTRYFLSEEHAEFVRGAFEEGSQAFDPSPVRTVARSMVAMLARAARQAGWGN